MSESNTCKNCNTRHTGNYCNVCGQKANIERYTIRRFFSLIFDAFNVSRGILYTFRMLIVNPGKAVNDYLNGRTKPYFNPLNYLLIAAGIYAVLVLWLNIFDSSIEATNSLFKYDSTEGAEEALKMQSKFSEALKGYINFIPLLLIPFASLISMWFYRSKKLFYGEHLIVNCFLFAQGFYISLLLIPLTIIFPVLKVIFGGIVAIVMIIYLSFALNRIYRRSLIRNILGSLLLYLGGMLFFYFFILIVFILFAIVYSLLGYNLTDLFQ